MGDLLGGLLEYADLPGRVADEVVVTYRAEYTHELVKNPSVGARANALMARMGAGDVAELIADGNKATLERVLEGTEMRASVVTATLEHWDLAGEDQVRLARFVYGTTTCDSLLRGNYVREAQEAAYAEASAGAVIEWLAHTGQVERLWVEMEARTPEVRMRSSLIAALLLTPELRERALGSQHDELRLAACWTELDLGLHTAAGAAAMAMGMTGDPLDPVAGLLNQPGLDWDVRLELETFQIEQAAINRAELVEAGARIGREYHNKGLTRRSPGDPGERLKDLNGATLASALRAAGRRTIGIYTSRERAITTTLLYGLSENQNLTEANQQLVVRLIAQHKDWRDGSHNPALAVAFERMARRMPEAQDEALKGVFRSETVAALRRVQDGKEPRTRLRVAPRREEWHGDDETLRATRIASVTFTAARRIGQMARASLGDATADDSLARWHYFLSLVEHSPRATLGEVLERAVAYTWAPLQGSIRA